MNEVTVMNGNEYTVDLTQLPEVVVSTVRLTINHGHGGTPLWYETLVFAHDGNEVTNWGELDGTRYTTEYEARAGHDKIVARWKGRTGQTPVWEDA